MFNKIRRKLLSLLKFLVKKFLILLREVDPDNGKNKDSISQISLMLQYRHMLKTPKNLPNINEVGFRVHSQTDEDGILLYIFSIIGVKNKKCVEMCSGDGIECNTANLIINHGWSGLLIDGNKARVFAGVEFYKTNLDTYLNPPILAREWITSKNVNKILLKNNFKGEIDFLSIDMDGVDYWIWDSINVIRPRVLAVEYRSDIDKKLALTVPYSDDFIMPNTKNGNPRCFGASLKAFVKLSKRKGYRLIGCNKYGYNAFFIRNELGRKYIKTVGVESCLKSFPIITKAVSPWVEV